MGSTLYHVLFGLVLACSPHSTSDLESKLPPSGYDWDLPQAIKDEPLPRCTEVKPTARDIVRRIYAILPYFDREHQNGLFLQKYRVTVNMMSESSDILDREAAFYAAVLTPIIFLQHYRDTWCLFERLQHALRQYQSAGHADKRIALKLLQNLRDLNSRVRSFISGLPDQKPSTLAPSFLELKDDDLRDKKDIRFLKELIKNLG